MRVPRRRQFTGRLALRHLDCVPMPIVEPRGVTDKVILISEYVKVSDHYAPFVERLDDLTRRSEDELIPKFDLLFRLFGV